MQASSIGCAHRGGVIRVVPERDGIVAICLEGEFDLANTPALSDQIGSLLGAGNDVILDLSEATFIDSSVINVLARASRAADEGGQTMVLQIGTAALVERILEIVSIEQVLPRANDRQEAVRIIRHPVETV